MTAFKNKLPLQIRYFDIDAQQHVNSAVYFTYFELSRVEYFNALFGKNARNYWADVAIVVAKAEMEYKNQLMLHDEAYSYVSVSRMGNKSFDMEFTLVKKENDNEIPVAQGKVVLVCINLKTNQTVPVPEEWKVKMMQ